jgi:hypothetical protein
MQAYQLLQRLRVDGLQFGLSRGLLAVQPRARITDEIRNAIKSRRDDLVQLIEAERRAPCPHDILERAAILEFDGGYSRAEADALALAEFGLANWDELALPNAGMVVAP